MATQIQVRPDTRDEKFSEKLIHPDIKEMFKKLKIRDYQIIVITDGGNGAYAYDGEHYYLSLIHICYWAWVYQDRLDPNFSDIYGGKSLKNILSGNGKLEYSDYNKNSKK